MKQFRLPLFFTLAYLISWTIWLPLYLPHFGVKGLPILPFHHALGALGPLTAAFIVTSMEEGSSGVKKLISKMGRWNVSILWYLIAFLVPFIMLIAGVLANNIIGNNFIDIEDIWENKEFPHFLFITFFLYNLIFFGFGEETGWRGYALPRLQEKMHSFWATLLLTFFWAGWHTPLFFYRPVLVDMHFVDIVGWFLSLLTGAVILTWLFNLTKQSILIVSIFHAAIDVAFTSKASVPDIAGYIGVLITIFGVVVLIVSRFKLGFKREEE